ncbi:nuclear transport factor 2 family protein [Hyphococcus flavus]|uniref:Nuclear transport factor 2 family protein n=1 Tax=Hyphococcus flavus TaxID=1866326 RepID=A0AAE9ZFP3_9PROT|nr:nuclear transport factor 2 family protein [Hyphococcus flavus]WDI32058.1 nuclear transport factor 2 family protein [Hyphococcus flavus]
MKKLIASLFAGVVAISPAWADAVEEMIAVDRAFSAMAQEESVPAAFAAYAADDVMMFPDGGQPYQGRDKLIERFSGWTDGATLEWFPQAGMASSSDDFGFTWGRYVSTSPGDEGEKVSHGKYISIWRKENGEWKFVADIGNSNPEPETP